MFGQHEDHRGSDRNLDALVAQQVMNLVPCAGWEVTNFGSAGGPALLKKCSHPADACYSTVTTGSVYGTIGGPARYSTDIRAAWRVVDRMLAILPRAEFRLDHRQGARWRAGIRSARTRRWEWVTADAAPETICRLALQLVQPGSNGLGSKPN